MTEKQRRFSEYYIQTGNASEAARLAGYSERSAGSIGEENLKKPAISERITQRLTELESERVATTREVMEHLSSVLRGEESETIVTNSGKKVRVPVRESDRLNAAEKLLRVHGAYRERVEVLSGSELLLKTLEGLE